MDQLLYKERAKQRAIENPEAYGGLFAQATPQTVVAVPDTSREAHRVSQVSATSKKARIVAAIEKAGTHGLTRLEIVNLTGFLRDTVNPRLRELLDADPAQIVEEGIRGGESVLVHVSCLAVRP